MNKQQTHTTTPRLAKASRAPRDWRAYNNKLVARGSLTVYFTPEAIRAWRAHSRSGRRGRPLKYSDACIEALLSVSALMRLPLRQAQGFAEAMLSALELDAPTPDYSTLSRRRSRLRVSLPRAPRSGAVTLLVDSTGLKVVGAGEWRQRYAREAERRQWRKLHVAVDAATGEVVAMRVTRSNVHDSSVFPELLAEASRGVAVARVVADGAYDARPVLRAVSGCRGRPAPVIPPRRNAVLARRPSGWRELRNARVAAIRRLGAAEWSRRVGYGERSLVETTMSQLKRGFGGELSSRGFAAQTVEATIRVKLLNEWSG